MHSFYKQKKTEKGKRKHAFQVAEALKKQIKEEQATGVLSGITDNIVKFALKTSEYISQFSETMQVGKQTVEIKLLGGSAIPIYSISYKDVTVVFRVISEADIDFSAYARARNHSNLNKYFPEQYAMEEFTHRFQKYYLEVLEYCGRKDLRTVNSDFISRIEYVRNMLQIMAALNAEGFCFTDIKPGNFVIADDGRLVLSDVKSLRDVLGIGTIPINELSNNISIGYQSLLDSVNNNPGSSSSDKPMVSVQEIDYESRYSLGISIYEVLTGHFVVSEHIQTLTAIKNLVKQRLSDQYDSSQSDFLQQQSGEAVKGLSAILEKMQKKDLREHLNLEHEVFQSPVGSVLKDIILSLTSKEKSQRMEVKGALICLEQALHLAQSSSAPSFAEENSSMGASNSNYTEPKRISRRYSQAKLPTIFRRSSSTTVQEREVPDTPNTDKREQFKQSGKVLSMIFSSPKKEKAKLLEATETPAP
ncbi:Protein kinase domain [Legionella steigerwaltii]|uniref:Protein kinase domain n=1 Tax=Legionella steigerwaltii TaxID=460 RepID=A0A378L5T7_9GAMM|nr:hypothetical protein [Legionella steigerwaltii]KTD69947.1 Protein kinase domain protein [Legionella steigerwaltii]STY21740.1 Protein kinase domain [Legionella steigerwaltii]